VGILLFGGLVTIGQALFTYGGYMTIAHPKGGFWTMVGARVVFGFGGESMTVAQSAIVS